MRAIIVPMVWVTLLSILPFAILTAMPWNAPDWVSFALPLVTLTAIHFWSEHRPWVVPPPLILGVGVLVDLITDGPLGYWALLFLLAHAIGIHLAAPVADAALDDSISASLRRFIIMMVIVSATGWAIACLYFVTLFNPLPLAAGALLATVLQPVVVYLLHPLLVWVPVHQIRARRQPGGTLRV